jgi:hypothetical protein
MFSDATLNEQYPAASNLSSRAGDAVRWVLQRLRAQHGSQRRGSQSVDEPMTSALQARLESIEREIDRVTRLALKEDDASKQEALLSLARDLQRDARAIRDQIRELRA